MLLAERGAARPANETIEHWSVTVNANRIKEMEVRTHGDHTVILKDGKRLPLSRSYRAQLEAWLRQVL
jgi:two-component system LytT family response regulator